jgi:hypothetical protein
VTFDDEPYRGLLLQQNLVIERDFELRILFFFTTFLSSWAANCCMIHNRLDWNTMESLWASSTEPQHGGHLVASLWISG